MGVQDAILKNSMHLCFHAKLVKETIWTDGQGEKRMLNERDVYEIEHDMIARIIGRMESGHPMSRGDFLMMIVGVYGITSRMLQIIREEGDDNE